MNDELPYEEEQILNHTYYTIGKSFLKLMNYTKFKSA